MFSRLLLGTVLGSGTLIGTHAAFLLRESGVSLTAVAQQTVRVARDGLDQPPEGGKRFQDLVNEVRQGLGRSTRSRRQLVIMSLAMAACVTFVYLRALPVLAELERRLVFAVCVSLLPWLGILGARGRDSLGPNGLRSSIADLVAGLLLALLLATCLRPKVLSNDITSRTQVQKD